MARMLRPYVDTAPTLRRRFSLRSLRLGVPNIFMPSRREEGDKSPYYEDFLSVSSVKSVDKILYARKAAKGYLSGSDP
jgi:hypothetical protein